MQAERRLFSIHYYVDGYNLLFRYMRGKEDLRALREEMIKELDEKAALFPIQVSVVFDAACRPGFGSREHYRCLEILFTSEGESADDFILREIERASHPHLKVVVTSDKRLALLARHLSAKTESVPHFIERINKGAKNKSGLSKKAAVQKRIAELRAAPSHQSESDPFLSAESNDMIRWLHIFEAKIRNASDDS